MSKGAPDPELLRSPTPSTLPTFLVPVGANFPLAAAKTSPVKAAVTADLATVIIPFVKTGTTSQEEHRTGLQASDDNIVIFLHFHQKPKFDEELPLKADRKHQPIP